MNKRILFVRTAPNEFNPKTYNVQGFGLGKAFCRKGYDFDFLCFSKSERKEYIMAEVNGYKMKLISRPRIRILRTSICREICNKEFLEKYDFIISCEYGQYMTYALSKVSDRVAMYSGPYYNMFFFPFMSFIYDKLFTKKINNNIKHKFVKSNLAKEFMENKGYDNVHSIGVALDLESFTNQIKIEPETQEIVDFMTQNNCILYIGALSDRKNFPFILEIYKKVYYDNPEIKFVMIGKGKRDYVESTLSQVDDEIKCNIFRVNQIDNSQLRFVYPLAKAFLLPSKLEIFGMVLLEAMYLGAPVISSRNGGSITLMRNERTGQIVEQFDANQWKNAVMKYINEPDYAADVVKEAHKLIEQEYNWDALASKMIKIISGEPGK